MQTDYHIEDLVFQNETLVVYRARTPNDTLLALVRLKYEDDIVAQLKERFPNALKELQSLNHSYLRQVLDGGIDPIDGYPWVAVRWWEGVILSDRIAKGPLLTQKELNRIKNYGTTLVETLGPVASTISFTPTSVVTCGNDPDRLVDTFSIDYHAWFHAFAQDIHPATLSASYQKLADLLAYLRGFSERIPATLITSDVATSNLRSTLTQAPSTQNPSSSPDSPSSTLDIPPTTKSSSPPRKILLLVSTLLIGTCLWFINQKRQTDLNSSTILADSSTTKKGPRPKRPRHDMNHVKVDATKPASIKTNIGKWVQVSGNIIEIDSQDHLVFDKSSLRATLPSTSQTTIAENTIGNSVNIQGFLESASHLDVEDQSDIDISYRPKDIYTLKDEAQLRQMENGQVVRVKGKIVAQTTSSTDKTLYLQLKTEKPEFSYSIPLSRAKASLTETYLRSLVNKTVIGKGPIRIDPQGSRISIVIIRKSNLTVVE